MKTEECNRVMGWGGKRTDRTFEMLEVRDGLQRVENLQTRLLLDAAVYNQSMYVFKRFRDYRGPDGQLTLLAGHTMDLKDFKEDIRPR